MSMAKHDSKSLSNQRASSAQGVGQERSPSQHSHRDASRLLQQRLELVEDLWKTVLISECPPEQTERLLRLKQLSDPINLEEGETTTSDEIVLLIRQMDLVEAISAARAFSLYFQLVNILEQRIEEDSYLASMSSTEE